MLVKSGFLYVILIKSLLFAQLEGSSFSRLPYVKLDGDMIKAITVPNILQCCWKCDRLPDCLSLNVADEPDKDGLYECHMLRTDTNKSPGLLRPSQRYHHYTRVKDQCDISKCCNGATYDTLGINGFRCHCPQGFTGNLCTVRIKMYKWLKINTSPVCFGAKDNSFGSFYIKENGTVTTVKLVHLSGNVTCNDVSSSPSKWGCTPFSTYPDYLMTIITDDTDQKILPQDEFILDINDFSYGLPSVTSMSPEILFKNFTSPMDVTAGQEYRIWYGQDLKDYTESNNRGTSCTDVYLYGLF